MKIIKTPFQDFLEKVFFKCEQIQPLFIRLINLTISYIYDIILLDYNSLKKFVLSLV